MIIQIDDTIVNRISRKKFLNEIDLWRQKNFSESFEVRNWVCLRNIAFIVTAIISAIIFDNISQILTGTVCNFPLTIRQIGFVFSRPN